MWGEIFNYFKYSFLGLFQIFLDKPKNTLKSAALGLHLMYGTLLYVPNQLRRLLLLYRLTIMEILSVSSVGKKLGGQHREHGNDWASDYNCLSST